MITYVTSALEETHGAATTMWFGEHQDTGPLQQSTESGHIRSQSNSLNKNNGSMSRVCTLIARMPLK